MSRNPETRASLLLRIRDSEDHAAWTEFVELYEPVIMGVLQHSGLQRADAADLTQDVLRSVSGAIGRLDYDPKIGRFRSWLLTIARNKLRNHFARHHRQPRGTGDTMMKQRLEGEVSGPDDLEQIWEREYQQRLFDWAVAKIRDQFQQNTWDAFWKTAVEGLPSSEVATELGLSVGAVYIAKSRVVARLKEQIDQVGDL